MQKIYFAIKKRYTNCVVVCNKIRCMADAMSLLIQISVLLKCHSQYFVVLYPFQRKVLSLIQRVYFLQILIYKNKSRFDEKTAKICKKIICLNDFLSQLQFSMHAAILTEIFCPIEFILEFKFLAYFFSPFIKSESTKQVSTL